MPLDDLGVVGDAVGSAVGFGFLFRHAGVEDAVVTGGGRAFAESFHEDVHLVFEAFEAGEGVDVVGEKVMGVFVGVSEFCYTAAEEAA